jgi:hypothetical protein
MQTISRLYSSDECDIFFNEELRFIHTQWKGISAEGLRLREIFNLFIMFLDLKRTEMIIADARNMLPISNDDQLWTINDWYPRAVKAGFRYQGLILSKNTFNELNVKSISSNYNEFIIVTEYFESPEVAIEWARSVRENLKVTKIKS